MGKDDLVGYLGLRGLSIPISLEIDAEVNNERVRATCYLLLAYLLLLCLLLLLLFPRRLLYISLSYSPSLPFSPPPLPISFLLFSFFGWGQGGEVGGGGKGGGIKAAAAAAAAPERGVGGTKSPPPPFHNNHPMQLKLKQNKLRNIYLLVRKVCMTTTTTTTTTTTITTTTTRITT